MKNMFLALRAALFYVAYSGFTTVYSLSALAFIWFLPFKMKFRFICYWNSITLFFVRIFLGINIDIKGLENLPKNKPFVVLSNHQSQLETFVLLLILQPVSIIIKKELLKIPGFGWGLGMLKPIAIDRSNPKKALREIQKAGTERLLEDKIAVMIFPEGTRVDVDEKVKYARSGASLAINTQVPVVFIAHNAGYFWPSDKFLKFPGTMEMVISKPQMPGDKNAKALTEEAQSWIESQIQPPKFR